VLILFQVDWSFVRDFPDDEVEEAAKEEEGRGGGGRGQPQSMWTHWKNLLDSDPFV